MDEERQDKKQSYTRFSAPCKRVLLEGALTGGCPRTGLGKQMMELDHFKKVQCSVTLKRLMVHPHAWPFKKPSVGNPMDQGCYSDILSKPLLCLETIKWKLEKGLYCKTDQFAGDIRIMFCNAMLHYPRKHEIHRMAVKLRELFETKWKSLEERWAAEKGKEEEEEEQKLKPSFGRVKRVFSVAAEAVKKRKLNISEENNTCPDSNHCQASPMVISSEKHFLDTILDSQKSLLHGNVDSERKIKKRKVIAPSSQSSCIVDSKKKEREGARMILQKIERTVFIDDNLRHFRELERLCGCSLTDCTRLNSPLKEILGLVLKDEFVTLMTPLEEEEFLGGDWEEGEIISFG